MVDIDCYRQRIGRFRCNHSSYYGFCFSNGSSVRNIGVFAFSLTFIVFLGLNNTFVSIPGIETNPGPSQPRKGFSTPEVRATFFKLKDVYKDISRVSCHHLFLTSCDTLNVVPRGFDKEKLSLASCKPTDALVTSLQSLNAATAREKMRLHISHYEHVIAQLELQKNELTEVLTSLCTTEDERAGFISELEAGMVRDRDGRQLRQMRKLNTLLDSELQADEWLPDLALTSREKGYILNNEYICDRTVDAALKLLQNEHPHISIQSTVYPHTLLVYSINETLHIHHLKNNHFVTTSTLGNPAVVTIYDSLNSNTLSPDLVQQSKALYSPDNSLPTIRQAHIANTQIGGLDCGLFSIAYAIELAIGNDPATFTFDQSMMRHHLITCLENRRLTPFPKKNVSFRRTQHQNIELPANSGTWTPPKSTFKPATSPRSHKLSAISLSTSNRFSPLQPECPVPDSPLATSTPLPNNSNCMPDSPLTASTPQHTNTNQSPTNQPTADSAATRLKQRKTNSNSIVYNLSKRKLTPTEQSVLELGLTFSPSTKPINQEEISSDVFQFIRKLKLREYFDRNHDESEEAPVFHVHDDERDPSKWQERHPDWYPDKVKNNRSEGLVKWIDSMLDTINGELRTNASKLNNNLTAQQRSALKALAADKSIVIKPADKGGALVILDSDEYQQACEEALSNTTFYEEIPTDPTAQYHDNVTKIANEMFDDGLINEFERETISRGTRTPLFYGLPKIHKIFDVFPALRPICSGSDGPTKFLSEFIDTFLKPLARRSASYLRDSTDFINKTRNIALPHDAILVTMDVEALYPNIDQREGAEACEEALRTRSNQTFSAALIKRLILTVLQSNCMQFGTRFFHQIKGTAMGTPMAVNFANLFMSKFERSLLDAFEKKHGMRPLIWLRFIDDVFFVWSGDESSLKIFIDFCNNYATETGMQSTIRFTSSYSKTSVEFLDMIVSIKDGMICTSLFSKPVDTHTYLHASSFHSRSTILSLPKTQFIRLRRLCSSIADYKQHAQIFTNFFVQRGYKKQALHKQAEEVMDMSRDELLTPKPKPQPDDHPTRTVLSVSWHPRLHFLQRALRFTHNRFTSQFPALKKTFPDPPMVAFRKNRSLRDILVHARHQRVQQPTPSAHSLPNSCSKLQKNMSTATKLTNNKSSMTVKTAGGSATSRNVVYAARCRRCDLIYVGYTTQPLNERFNIHRSDITHYPDRSELPKHFHSNPSCDFDRDLELHILQRDAGDTRALLEAAEDKWVLRLQTSTPNGMNKKLNEYGSTFKKLFG